MYDMLDSPLSITAVALSCPMVVCHVPQLEPLYDTMDDEDFSLFFI